jgi:hypothetical protein
MTKGNIISQTYGYIVCLVTVLVFLFNLPNLVKAIINISDIDYARGAPSVLTESYEKWKFDFLKTYFRDYGDKDMSKIVKVPEKAELMEIFKSEKTAARRSFKVELIQDLIKDILLVFVSLALFLFHWKWLRKIVPQKG